MIIFYVIAGDDDEGWTLCRLIKVLPRTTYNFLESSAIIQHILTVDMLIGAISPILGRALQHFSPSNDSQAFLTYDVILCFA